MFDTNCCNAVIKRDEDFYRERGNRYAEVIANLLADYDIDSLDIFPKLLEEGKLSISEVRYIDDLCRKCRKFKQGNYNKPPIGIEPRSVWEEKRRLALANAIDRYLHANRMVPDKWIKEYNELSVKLGKTEEAE